VHKVCKQKEVTYAAKELGLASQEFRPSPVSHTQLHFVPYAASIWKVCFLWQCMCNERCESQHLVTPQALLDFIHDVDEWRVHVAQQRQRLRC
jgi:hypothetical protein